MKKHILLLAMLLIVCSVWAQKFETPAVTNTVSSVETAFLALLYNMASLSESSVMVDHIKYEDTHNRYTVYLDYVLTNMTFEKVKAYFLTIAACVEKIDYQGLSQGQQNDFEYFLNTAIADRWRFGTGAIKYILPSSVILEYNNDPLNEIDKRTAQELENLQIYEKQLMEMPDLAVLQIKIDNTVREYRELQNSQPRTQRAVVDKENRLKELKKTEMDTRKEYQDNTSKINSLRSRIDTVQRNISILMNQKEKAQKQIQIEAEQNYFSTLHKQINNYYAWKDFFNNKNNFLKEFLIAIDVKEHLLKIVHDEVPQRQVEAYRQKLDAFCTGWGI